MRKGIIFVNSARCVGCKRCSMACAVEHSPYDDFFDLVRNEGTSFSRVLYRPVGQRVIPIECRHCEGAQCAVACPTGAIARSDEGAPVVLNPDICVGCRSCIVACPYGAIRVAASTGEIYKCDFCIDRTSKGRKPACVEACPTKCLTFSTVEELEKDFNVPQEIAVTLIQSAAEKGD
jgi:carbon-monoxide dehydrogenase iron sulfur subunit